MACTRSFEPGESLESPSEVAKRERQARSPFSMRKLSARVAMMLVAFVTLFATSAVNAQPPASAPSQEPASSDENETATPSEPAPDASDANASDANAKDTTASDANAKDPNASDANAKDTTASDANASDTNASDTNAKDSTASDTNAKDPNAKDSTASDTNAEDAGDSNSNAPSSDPSTPATPSTETLLRTRALQIRGLIDGDLDAEINARALFIVDLADPLWASDAGVRFARILGALQLPPPESKPKPRSRRRARREPPRADLEALEPDAALEAALVEFFTLEPSAREALLTAHDARHSDAEAAKVVDPDTATRIERTRSRAEALRDYLDGTLDVEAELESLLTLDLLDSTEVTTNGTRRSQWLRTSPQDAASLTANERGLRTAHAELDLQRQRFLALSSEQRDALAATHQARAQAVRDAAAAKEAEDAQALADDAAQALAKAEADDAARALAEEAERTRADAQQAAEALSDAEAEADAAARAQAEALEAAQRADTQAKRVVAQERARLLGIKQEQATYEADVARRKVERAELHDGVLQWTVRVEALEGSTTMYASELAAEADPMYDEIREDLGVLRERMAEELARLQSGDDDIPGVGTPLDASLPTNVDRGDIRQLRAEVAQKEKELHELERSTGWALAEQTRDDVVALNARRLALLELASPSLRSAVTSFGAQGVDQAKREFKQISLEVNFFLRSLPRHRDTLFDELQSSTIQVAFAVAKLTILIVAFVWWRRRGSAILMDLEKSLRAKRPTTSIDRALIGVVWYLRRVRRPLVMLAVIWGLLYILDDIEGVPSLDLVWIAASWILLGLAAVLLVDAIAAREHLYTASKRDNSKLRIHSLRTVGINVIAVGMVLGLTSATVGRGAIYAWVLSTCWLLSFPVVIYLVHRWKPIIFELIEERPEQTGFTQWVTSKKTGVASFAAAAVGAGYLLTMGSLAWLMRQLSGLEVTRRLLAYLFRRELAKQAAATEADGRFSPIEDDIAPHFDPEAMPSSLLGEVGESELNGVLELVGTRNATFSAIVGERGAGKSAFVERLSGRAEDLPIHRIDCPEEGIESMFDALAKLVEQPGVRGPALIEAVRGLGRCVVVIDDLQRLVIPAVNGLRGLDTFAEFQRNVGGEVSWVVTIGAASWQFIRRARGEQVSFDQVVNLPRWNEDQLGKLIQSQCEHAGITPSFDGLVVPRQNGEPLPDQGDRTEASYYRLLWDFSKGNPAVALHAFRASLFRDENNAVIVRLFKEPPADEVEGLSLSMLFVLRTIVQLELALPHEIEAATQLQRSEVEDALRFCSSRGYVEPFQGGVRLSWPWYRTITTVLQRQHLLSEL